MFLHSLDDAMPQREPTNHKNYLLLLKIHTEYLCIKKETKIQSEFFRKVNIRLRIKSVVRVMAINLTISMISCGFEASSTTKTNYL